MSTWERCIAFVQAAEGEWDRSRTTRWGIDKRFHPHVDLETLTQAGAAEILRAEYWRPINGDALPWPISLLVFDQAVHDGPRDAARALQETIGVKDDGRIGPKTLARLEAMPDSQYLVRELLHKRSTKLIHGNWNMDRRGNLPGFMNRLLDLALVVGRGQSSA